MSRSNLYGSFTNKLKNLLAISFLAIAGLVSVNAQAEIRVLAAGGDLLGPYGTEQIFANGDLVGSIDRPSWSAYRELTTADIINNYDVIIIPRNTADWQYDFDWSSRLLPFMANGGGVVWEAPMTTGLAGAPIFTMQGIRYTCNGGASCTIPASPLNVLSAAGLSDGIGSDFTFTTGYFPSWDASLAPFIQVNATDLGTITYGLYGEVSSGRIVITSNAQDDVANPNGTAAEVNAYNLLINKIQWAASSTTPADPNLRIVPDTDGMTEADAVTALSNDGFVVANVFYTVTNDDTYGNVVGSDPQAGTMGFVNDSINLFVVSQPYGPEVTVPNVKGMLTADAELALEAVNLFRGQLVWAADPTVPAGAIISQNPVAGATSTEEWDVNVAESSGPNPGKVPFVKWLSQASAQASIVAAGYVVGNIAVQSHNVIPSGNVVEQTPNYGATLDAGSSVSLVISSGPVGSAPIVAPSVVGLSQAAAESAIASAGLNVSVSTANSESVAAGNVIGQTPAGGTEVAAGSVVSLVVSIGPAPVVISVPNVTGGTQTSAESAITAAGLVVGNVTTVDSDTVAAGDVVSQNPTGGTNVNEGSAVNLVISNGPAPVVISVPSVEGMSQAAAESVIVAASLSVGNVTTANSSSVAAGNVISQTPAAGSNVGEATAVDLLVSVGPAMVDVPAVTGSLQSAAESAITSAGLSVGNVTTASSETVAIGNVISQNPAAGTNVSEGSTVDLVVSSGPVAPPPPAGPIVVFSDSFENGAWNGLWTEDSQGDWFTNSQRASSGSRSAEVDGSASDAQLISIPVDLQGGTDASISFNWYIESGLDSGEYLAFDVSTNGGASWTQQATLRGNVDSENTWHSVQVDLNGISSLQLRFRARMSSSREDANIDDVSVVVQAGGTPPPVTVIPPVADAGSDQTVTEGDTVNLNGSASSDADGTIVSYQWSAPAGVNLSSTTSATPSFTAPAGSSSLTFTLTVTDNDGQTDSSSVTITVDAGATPPPPPTSGPIEVFSDSFENGAWNGLWTEDSQGDWFTNSQRASSGSRSAEVDGSASDAQLISTSIDLQGGSQASISFNWYIESGLDSGEYLAFDVSTDGGASWSQQAMLRGNVDSENTWHSVQVDLNGISSLQLRFRAKMSSSREDANLDDVSVVVQ